MKELNILLLSAGRRVELVKCFQSAAKRLGIDSKVIAGDCSKTAPALYFADKSVILPRIDEPDYIDKIIEECIDKNVKLVVPTIDTDLILLANERERIEFYSGAKVLISSNTVVSICRDKVYTQEFLEKHGFNMPKRYLDDEIKNGRLQFPLFIKPRSGSSSINTFKVNNYDELRNYCLLIKDPIVQDFVEGEEYTVDVFLDFNSNLITVVPRLRISTRSGEIAKGKVIRDREIIDDIKRLVKVLKPIGQITVQLIKTCEGIKYIEINPRFGGGAPMSIYCGADSCENLYRLLMGETIEYYEDYQDNVLCLRYDSSICLNEGIEII